MEENVTLGRPYAQAAFRHAESIEALPQWSQMLILLSGLVSDRQMKGIITDPRVSKGKLEALLLDLCGERLAPGGDNFIRLLVANGRVLLAGTIGSLFEQERQRSEGRVEVRVISAFPLDTDAQARLSDTMVKWFEREVDLSVSVDDSLIGGVILRAGDTVVDASLRGRLQALSDELGR